MTEKIEMSVKHHIVRKLIIFCQFRLNYTYDIVRIFLTLYFIALKWNILEIIRRGSKDE